jgi:DNA-binding beta-propeller fold protein YncE
MTQHPQTSGLKVGFALLLVFAGQAFADRIVLFAGGGASSLPAPALEAALREPFGTEFDEKGNAWIVEMVSGNRLLKVSSDGVVSHFAGRPEAGFSGDGGPGLEAQFHGPHNLAVLRGGRILVGDTWNGRVREVDAASGKLGSLPGFDVPVARAKGAGPYCITADPEGTKLYIADLTQVWELEINSGSLRRIAGNGKKGIPQDGAQAVEAPLVDPRAVAPDKQGNIYILERGGHALRVVDKEGRIRTVVNASGKAGSHGDGGPALDAALNGPKHLCVDRDDSVLIADAENNLIRRYVPASGRMERVAGTGKKGATGVGGAPEACELARPHGVTVHPVSGELFITDSYNNRVLKIVRE